MSKRSKFLIEFIRARFDLEKEISQKTGWDVQKSYAYSKWLPFALALLDNRVTGCDDKLPMLLSSDSGSFDAAERILKRYKMAQWPLQDVIQTYVFFVGTCEVLSGLNLIVGMEEAGTAARDVSSSLRVRAHNNKKVA